MERLDTLRQKLDDLLRHYNAAKGELASARRTLAAKEEEASLLRTRLTHYEEDVLALQIGQAIPDAESRAAARRQLDAVIAEIDKILMTIP